MRLTILLFGLILAPLTASAGDTPWFATEDGKGLYMRFCAACHGPEGAGDGPVAASLKTVIPDLRQLNARFGGKFPAERVEEIVDGRAVLPAHGTRPMPVWGYEFEAQVEGAESGRAAAQAMIERLTEYLRSIQLQGPPARDLD